MPPKKRLRGRPKIANGLKLVTVSASITPEQKRWLERGAREREIKFVQFLRLILKQAMELEPAEK